MESAVSDHKFKIGQSVQYTSGPYGRGTANGVYKITQLLPPKATTASTGSRAPTSRMSGSSGRANSQGINSISSVPAAGRIVKA